MSGLVGFKNIIGHSKVKERLQRVLQKPGHSYVIVGEAGLGKLALAKAFAKALQCEANSGDADVAIDSCNACLSCRVFDSGNHPDVLYVNATKTKSIGVEDIRNQLVLPMSEKPFRYPYKIFIVNQPLTPQAQNALLKTIEEPAPFGVFLFLTESASLYLSTVLSRSITIKLGPLTDEEVAQTVGTSPENLAVKFAQGNPGRAKDLMESEDFAAMQTLAKTVSTEIRRLDIVGVFALFPKFEKWKESIQNLLDILYMQYFNEFNENGMPGLSAISDAKKALKQNGNFQMTIEIMLLKLNEGVQSF